jgi:hypothetical protein
VETYIGRVAGVDVDVVYEDEKKKIIKDMFGIKVLENVGKYWIVANQHKNISDMPQEELKAGKFLL